MFEPVSRTLAGSFGPGEEATLDGYARYEALVRPWGKYPYIEKSEGDKVEGKLFRDISETQLKILDWFENTPTDYARGSVEKIRLDSGGEIKLNVYIYVVADGLRNQIDTRFLGQHHKVFEKWFNSLIFKQF